MGIFLLLTIFLPTTHAYKFIYSTIPVLPIVLPISGIPGLGGSTSLTESSNMAYCIIIIEIFVMRLSKTNAANAHCSRLHRHRMFGFE